MSVRHGILGILAKGPQHGYELKQSFEDASGGFWNVNYGQIYTTLDRLVADDLVDMTIEPGGEGKGHERKIYHITPRGLSEFREWLDEPVGKIRPLRDEVFIKLALLGGDDPEPALHLLREQRQLYLVHMAQLTQKKQAMSRRNSRDAFMADLLIDAALFHAEADLRWLEHCEAKIRTRHAKTTTSED